MADISISELPLGSMSSDSLFLNSQPNAQTGRVTTKLSGTALGEGLLNDIDYSSLNTGSKKLIPAINELLIAGSIGVKATGTLVAGQTSLTINNAAIHADSFVELFVDDDHFDLFYTGITVQEGSVTATFEAQAEDVSIGVFIRGIAGAQPTQESYIYNVGQCAFNTGYKHTANTKVRFKARMLCNSTERTNYGYMAVFGARNGNFRNNAMGFFERFNAPRCCYYRTNYESSSALDTATEDNTYMWFFEDVIVECEGAYARYWRERDSATVHSVGNAGATINGGIAPLGLFCHNTSSTADAFDPTDLSTMYLYWFEIYENDTLVHRFVPAYNNSQYCLYDQVDQDYIYDTKNSGTYMRGFIAQ